MFTTDIPATATRLGALCMRCALSTRRHPEYTLAGLGHGTFYIGHGRFTNLDNPPSCHLCGALEEFMATPLYVVRP